MGRWRGVLKQPGAVHRCLLGSGSATASATSSCPSVLLKFKEFIRNFEKEKNVFPYRESLVTNPKFLVVNLEDLLSFDSDLPSLLRSSPSDYLPLCNGCIVTVLKFSAMQYCHNAMRESHDRLLRFEAVSAHNVIPFSHGTGRDQNQGSDEQCDDFFTWNYKK
ncbi:hypothetical protein J1N35_032355 [Gossypium stocksii]|uniref:MCM N-terminal domain-containing protein n=1 Tax=Gossypium stocksii TaxID=47602 RepID=A0A9D3V343_9ROSI|nr:hypothetical protein J1N35_032355 [Gossypium stocksii]